MPVYYLYVYAPSDFVGGLPDEVGAAADGTAPFTLQLLPGAAPTLIAVDDDEAVFDEVDGSQVLVDDVTIGGGMQTAGTTVVSAYDLINSTTGHQVTSLHFGVAGGVQGPVDGLVSTIELVPGVSYTFDRERTSHLQPNAYANSVACFVAGTRLMTPRGPVAVEDLAVGDLVQTLDCGVQPLCWTGFRQVPGRGSLAPIRIAAGWNGLGRDLVVSPNHRMLVSGAGCELAVGEESAFVTARQLAEMGHARFVPCSQVTYHHIMFDSHQVVMAEGAPSESMLANDLTLTGVAAEDAEEIRVLFPELSTAPMKPARAILRAHEAYVAVTRMGV